MDKVQQFNNPNFSTLSSQPYRIQFSHNVLVYSYSVVTSFMTSNLTHSLPLSYHIT